MPNVEFSIIVPIYNTANYLSRCIDSVIDQSMTNIEIILVNDGSTDSSRIICEEYVRKDNRIRLINMDNSGVSEARNSGIYIASGNYIIFLDSDDYICRDTCKVLKRELENNNCTDIIALNMRSLDANYNVVKMDTYYDPKKIVNGKEFLKIQLNRKSMHMSACRNVYNRKFLMENNLYFKKGILHEDEQWTPRVYLVAERVLYIDYIHYSKVLRDGSITRSEDRLVNALFLIDIVRELNSLYQEIDDNELKSLLLDYNVELQLNAFYIGKMTDQKYKILFDKKELVANSYKAKNKIKAILFAINRRIYYQINHTSKKIIRS